VSRGAWSGEIGKSVWRAVKILSDVAACARER